MLGFQQRTAPTNFAAYLDSDLKSYIKNQRTTILIIGLILISEQVYKLVKLNKALFKLLY